MCLVGVVSCMCLVGVVSCMCGYVLSCFCITVIHFYMVNCRHKKAPIKGRLVFCKQVIQLTCLGRLRVVLVALTPC